jgi:small conductance mechanosensitive channel
MNFNDFYTRGYGWVLLYGPRLIAALILLFAGFWLVRKMKLWINYSLGKREVDPSLRPFLISFSGIILQVLLIVSVMQVLGIEMTVFATVMGAFGVAVG